MKIEILDSKLDKSSLMANSDVGGRLCRCDTILGAGHVVYQLKFLTVIPQYYSANLLIFVHSGISLVYIFIFLAMQWRKKLRTSKGDYWIKQ